MSDLLRLCGIQLETGGVPGENVEKAMSLLGKAARSRPDFVVLPEMFEIVPAPSEARAFSHAGRDELLETLARAARLHSLNLVGGTILEREGDDLYNTCFVFDRRGELRGRYRKIHLFDAFDYGESGFLKRGREPLVATLDGLRFGVAICYDIRFPELFRVYALSGASVVFVPSAFFRPNHDHWELCLRSRALDSGIFVMGCNQTGKRFVGRSGVADPWGIPVASMGLEEGYFFADIDLEAVDNARRRLPLLSNRRYDVTPLP